MTTVEDHHGDDHPYANGRVSFWYTQMGGVPGRREPLPGDRDVDICVVGAGFTGLWTAYYLKKADPSLRIAVLEREFAGFGASGRNGGWASGLMPGVRETYAKTHGDAAVRAQQRAMTESVDELARVAAAEQINADIIKGGTVRLAFSRPQLVRLRASIQADHHWGVDESTILSDEELASRIRLPGTVGGAYTPHCARIQPAKLVRGLSEAVVRMGVDLYESTPVASIQSRVARTMWGTVRAPVIVRATEGFTAQFPGQRRSWLPMNSAMIATEPLGPEVWDALGWDRGETLGDKAYSHLYAQRTADDRIALGGRGVPYRFRSATDRNGETQRRTIESLREVLHRRFPGTRNVAIAHAWCGVLAVPRDWCATVRYNRRTGLAVAGGYSGQGVTATNLAGRTLTDLILGVQSELVTLPWVDHASPEWEPEPLRWLGVRTMYRAYRYADRAEFDGRPAGPEVAKVADLISGRQG